MGVFDYVQAQGPPSAGQWSGPNMAEQLYKMIGGLPDNYFTGTQNARTLALQNQFKNGLPTRPDGQPDISAIAGSLAKTGGAEYAKELLPFLLKQNVLDEDKPGGGAPVQPEQPQQRPPNLSPHGQTADTLRAAAQPQQAPSGDNAQDTVRSIATELGGPNRDLAGRIPNYARAIGVDPDAPLSPAQAQRARAIIRSNVTPTGGPAGTLSTAEDNDTTPVGSGANPGGAGAPMAAPPQQNLGPRPVKTLSVQRPATADDPAAGMLPPGYQGDSRAFATAAHQRAEALRAQARREGIAGIPSKALEDQAASLDARATKIDEAWAKQSELTPEQKNVASGTEERKGQIGADLKYYDSLHRGLSGSAMIAAQQKQNVDMLRQVAASPNFTPGAGSDLALGFQRLAAQFGINPAGAAPREIFNQVSARILADQFSGMKSLASETGEQGARIFKPMLDIEEKANITPYDSLEGVKAKIDLIDKTGDLMMKWGDKADDYKLKHGRLDAGFDKELRADIAKARVPNIVPGAEKGAAASGAPAVGHVEQGFRFKGGNHRDPKSWEPVSAGDRT